MYNWTRQVPHLHQGMGCTDVPALKFLWKRLENLETPSGFFASRFLTSSGQVLWAEGRFRQHQMRAVMGYVTMAVPVYLLSFLWGQGKMRLFFSGGSNSLRKSAIVCVVTTSHNFLSFVPPSRFSLSLHFSSFTGQDSTELNLLSAT